MDIMQIKSNFMRGLISKFIASAIYKKLGYKVKIDLEDIDVKVDEETAHIHINADVDMSVNELKKFTRLIDD